MKTALWIPLFILLAWSCKVSHQQCISESDLGRTQCVRLTPYYSEYQWATCLTDSYIRERSGMRHYCRNSAVRCWYQCQNELHNLASGAVYDDCRCSPNDQPPTNLSTLNAECFSPDGSDCTWYRQCLEQRYPCEGTSDGYAIEFGQKFCNLYTDRYNTFTTSGQQWIDKVRRCLQVALVPSLRPWIQKSCAEIHADAFESHPPCYLNPGDGAPSICNLECGDLKNIVWLVFGNMNFLSSAFVNTITQTMEVAARCKNRFTGSEPCFIEAKTFVLSVGNSHSNINATQLANSVGKYTANLLEFASKRIGWFPLTRTFRSSRKRRQLEEGSEDDSVTLLIDSLEGVDLPTVGTGRAYSVDEIVMEMAEAVRSGQLSNIPVSDGDTEVRVGVVTLGECGDLLCSNGTNITVLATSGATTPGTLIMLHTVLAVGTLLATAWTT